VSNFACELYRYFGLTDEAIAAGERALQLDPAFLHGEPLLAAVYREMGRFDDAIVLYEKAQSFTGNPGSVWRLPTRVWTGATKRRKFSKQQWRAGTLHARRRHCTCPRGLGDYDDAIRELERACEERSSSASHDRDCSRIRAAAFG